MMSPTDIVREIVEIGGQLIHETATRLRYRTKSRAFPLRVQIPVEYSVACAHCGCGFMHQSEVEIFRRNAEDSSTGLHAWVRGVEFVTSESVEGNPSLRRDAVVLSFCCEQCESTTVLEFVKHKGTEYVFVNVDVEEDAARRRRVQ